MMRRRSPRRSPRRGFTLVEVMLALAILAMSLVILVKSVATNVTSAGESFYMGVVTDLTRSKMYDLEEKLLDEGFQDAEQEEDGDFSDEGWPGIKWHALIEPAELPSYEKLMGMQPGQGEGGEGQDGDGDGEPDPGAVERFESSALGGMMSMMGMGMGMGGGAGAGAGGAGADTASEANTGAFIQGYYSLVQQVLKASIRKITLTVKWDTGLRKEEIKVILYVTDPAGMQKTMGALGQ
jgi:general secretion pathway protein I